MPKERFVLYPDAGRETDPTPLLGWDLQAVPLTAEALSAIDLKPSELAGTLLQSRRRRVREPARNCERILKLISTHPFC